MRTPQQSEGISLTTNKFKNKLSFKLEKLRIHPELHPDWCSTVFQPLALLGGTGGAGDSTRVSICKACVLMPRAITLTYKVHF